MMLVTGTAYNELNERRANMAYIIDTDILLYYQALNTSSRVNQLVYFKLLILKSKIPLLESYHL